MTTITKDNYYDVRNVLSASTIKAFANCEAAALADLRGEYQRPTSTALLVGSYIDAGRRTSLPGARAMSCSAP